MTNDHDCFPFIIITLIPIHNIYRNAEDRLSAGTEPKPYAFLEKRGEVFGGIEHHSGKKAADESRKTGGNQRENSTLPTPDGRREQETSDQQTDRQQADQPRGFWTTSWLPVRIVSKEEAQELEKRGDVERKTLK
eukprot:comp15533_c0_seq2/m.23757 comp15533_c0_seq2/g.23757  ORF comp15533_c0_seq2/g.23757 comp15533_c0_seq2/m.23757 type:complete len:135 (-) comp15533_c0_seq2:3-407(-)